MTSWSLASSTVMRVRASQDDFLPTVEFISSPFLSGMMLPRLAVVVLVLDLE